jgi:hypothetical protein
VTVTQDSSEKSFSAVTHIKTAITSATFLGYVCSGDMVITDLLRLEGREVNVDISRANYDNEELEPFLTSNLSPGPSIGDDKDYYDILLRSEYGVFRARSIVKTRVYDKIGWFYDYIQTMGLNEFESLYELRDSPLKLIIDRVKNLLKEQIPVTTVDREMNSIMEELIISMDNRYAPPLITNVKSAPNRMEASKFAKQNLNGNVFQLNKYYVISRSSAANFSIDPPIRPFEVSYFDNYFQYRSEEISLFTTNFARFPSKWNDEIYENGVIRYDKLILLEEQSEAIEFKILEDFYGEIKFYQPYHDNPEENFFAEFSKLKLNMEPDLLIAKKRGNKRKK